MWRYLAGHDFSSRIVARINDLLIEAQDQQRPAYAAKAIRAYCAAASEEDDPAARLMSLGRALTLSMFYSVPDSLETARELALEILIQDDYNRFAPVARIDIARLYLTWLQKVGKGMKGGPDLAAQQANQVLDSFRAQGVSEYTYAPLIALFASAPDKKQVHAKFVVYLLQRAGTEEGFVSASTLNRAHKIAQSQQLSTLERRAAALSQKEAQKAKDWQSFQKVVRIPRALLGREVMALHRHDDWRRAFLGWILMAPPAGVYESNMASAKESLDSSTFRLLVTNVEYNEQGYPTRTLDTYEDHLNSEMARGYSYSLQLYGHVAADALRSLQARFPSMTGTGITSFLRDANRCDEGGAERLGRAIDWFFVGNYDQAFQSLVLNYESLARELLLLLNAPLFRAEVGSKSGQFPGLDFYLQALSEEGYDKSWVESARGLLCAAGLNLRNKFAHGFQDNFTAEDATNMIRLYGHLLLSAPRFIDPDSTGGVGFKFHSWSPNQLLMASSSRRRKYVGRRVREAQRQNAFIDTSDRLGRIRRL